MKEIPRVVIDTNIFVSALLGSKNAREILDNLLDGKFKMVISERLFEEVMKVIRRNKFCEIIEENEIVWLQTVLKTDAEWIMPMEKVSACRDAKDNVILECAIARRVNFVVTGDKDLLALSSFQNIAIITPEKFLRIL